MVNIKLLPAENGDCIIISFRKEKYNMLIDGGVKRTYINYIEPEIQRLKNLNQRIDLIVCTHMDNDHITGLIHILKNDNSSFVKNIWYNGFLQVVNEKYYSHMDNNFTLGDNKILEEIISKGTLTDNEQEIGINEGMSLGVLIEEKKIPLNSFSNNHMICSNLINQKYKISKNIAVFILGPSKENIQEVENYWKKDMVSRNYMFRVSNKIKLMSAFEFQLENIKSYYEKEGTIINEIDGLEKYIGDLNLSDESIVNKSSISFIIEYENKRYLFLGDAVVDESLLKNLEIAVGEKYHFSAIKLPHHGSRYNINHEFIHRYTADEYYCLTDSKKYNHPDLEVLASIICDNQRFKRLVFNYPIDKASFLDKIEWKKRYNYEIVIGNGKTVMERVFE